MSTDLALLRGALIAQCAMPVIVRPCNGEPHLELETDPESWADALAGLELPAVISLDGHIVEASCLPGAQVALDPRAEAARSTAPRAHTVAGKVAAVTGGAQGFGEEIVRGLHASGAFVYIVDLNLDGASKLATELGQRAVAVECDVAQEESVEALAHVIRDTTGGLDIVVSNAGVARAGAVLEQDLSAFALSTEVNYTAFFLLTKHLGRILRTQSQMAPEWMSDIIQINSKSGLVGSNRNGAYAGSKFGGIGLVQSFALELIDYNIKVNAICPGNFFDGPLWSHPDKGLFVQYLHAGKVPGATTVEDVKRYYEAKVPMGRGTVGADVLRALYYIIEQAYETGQAVPVTGGQVMLSS